MVNKLVHIILIITLSFCFASNSFSVGNDSNTVLLLHNDADPFTDSSVGGAHGDATEVADVDLDEVIKKFGSGSAHFDGDSGQLYFADSDDWWYGTSDFTIDSWVRFDSVTIHQGIMSQRTDTTSFMYIYWHKDTGDLRFYYKSGNVERANFACTWAPDVNTWYHIAIVRDGNNELIFIDGVSQVVTVTAGWGDLGDIANILRIGNNSTVYMDGHIDEFRISDVARWTANFDVPTEEYNGVVVAVGQVIVVN